MAHFAELDEQNKVLRVLVTDNNAKNEGYDWLVENLGGRWIQTSYNANIRNKFAGVGDLYLEDLDVFVSPKPFDSWSLNETTLLWDSPIEYPTDGKNYEWDESVVNWIEVQGE